jgi:hypothetical protein
MPSTKLKKAATAPETTEVLVTLLKIIIEGKGALFLTDNTEPVVSGGITFIPCAFKALLPDQSAEGNKSCRLQIDNADLSIYKAIKEAVQKTITCEVAIVLASTPNIYEQGPFTFVLRNITADVSNITGELYDSYMHDRKLTNRTYNPADFPGLFF